MEDTCNAYDVATRIHIVYIYGYNPTNMWRIDNTGFIAFEIMYRPCIYKSYLASSYVLYLPPRIYHILLYIYIDLRQWGSLKNLSVMTLARAHRRYSRAAVDIKSCRRNHAMDTGGFWASQGSQQKDLRRHNCQPRLKAKLLQTTPL